MILLALVCGSCQRQEPPELRPGKSVQETPFHEVPQPSVKLEPLPSPEVSSPLPTSAEDTFDPIGDVLSADLTPGETTSRLLSLLASTPADDQSFLVQIAGNYCPDEEYWRLLPFLLNRNLPEDCREELLRDVLRRPDPVRLRPLYRLALDPTHPLSTEAREYLFAYLQDVPENDFNALARAVEKAEKENR
jgi:hypothetical protein